jgi:hypothetical protein
MHFLDDAMRILLRLLILRICVFALSLSPSKRMVLVTMR